MNDIKKEMTLGELMELQRLLFQLGSSYRGIELRQQLNEKELKTLDNTYDIVTDLIENH